MSEATHTAKHTPGPWRNCAPSSNFQRGKRFIRPVGSEALIAKCPDAPVELTGSYEEEW